MLLQYLARFIWPETANLVAMLRMRQGQSESREKKAMPYAIHKDDYVAVVERSSDSKLGNVSATYASQATCPSVCPFFGGNGCYAETGNTRFTTNRLNRAGAIEAADAADREAIAIGKLSGKYDLRLHVVGDAKTDYAASKLAEASAAHSAKHGRSVWTYTHGWRDVDRASWGSVSVLASCETVDDVKAAQAKGYATALVVESEFHSDKLIRHESGVKVLPCREQVGTANSCSDCRLCWNDANLRTKGITIGFSAHGAKVNSARAAINRIKAMVK